MMTKFSILLPTLRPKLFQCALFGITFCSEGCDYEVIAVSPVPVAGERVRWIKETTTSGCIAANLQGYEECSGDLIVLMTDDTIVFPGWLQALEAAIREGESQHFPYCVGLNRVNLPVIGTVFGKYYAYFPAMSRRSLEAVGGLFDPQFVAHWADPDLGMRVWSAGGRVEFCENARAAVSSLQFHYAESKHKTSAFYADTERFLKKWGYLAGNEFSLDYRDVNRDLPRDVLRDRTVMIEQVRKGQKKVEPKPRRTFGSELQRRLRRPPPWVRHIPRHVRSAYEWMHLRGWGPAEMYTYELGWLAERGYL